MPSSPAFAVVAREAEVRTRIRTRLETLGLMVVTEAESLTDLAAGEIAADLVVMEPPSVVDHDDRERGETLTARERDVLEWLSIGLSNKAIAQRLGISEHTVKFHITSIYGKLGASSRAQAIRRAARRGLITI